MNQALASRDPDTITQAGHAVRSFEAPATSPPSTRKLWRREKLELWLIALSGDRAGIDPAFSPNDRPLLNLAPMAKDGVRWDAGVDPAEIKDAEVRADYERRLAANVRKATEYRYQQTLRRLDAAWTNELKNHVTAHYTRAPADVAEIRALIAKRVRGESDRAWLEAVLLKDAAAGAALAAE